MTSFIVTGADAEGREEYARRSAKALLCADPRGGEACGVCPVCRAVSAGACADLIVYGAGEKAANVAEIRALREEAHIRPYYSERKVFIIQRAGEMNEQAQNALLKTLEEPPGYAAFFLLAGAEGQLLATVRSRCVARRVPPYDRLAIIQALAERGISGEAAGVLAAVAQGSLGTALRLAASETFAATRLELIGFAERGGGALEALELAKGLAERKGDVDDALMALGVWYRDALACALGAGRHVWQRELADRLMAFGSRVGARVIAERCAAVARARAGIRRNGNLRLALDVLFLEVGLG